MVSLISNRNKSYTTGNGYFFVTDEGRMYGIFYLIELFPFSYISLIEETLSITDWKLFLYSPSNRNQNPKFFLKLTLDAISSYP